MEVVAIAIATFKRPKMLSQALYSLTNMILPEETETILLVSDNDPEKSAEQTFQSFSTKLSFTSKYFSESRQGIVPNRNKLLSEASKLGAKYLAFFDDDERVDPKWLVELLKASKQFQAEAVWGKTIYSLPPDCPDWLSRRNFYGGDQPPTGTKRRGASTNNVLIDLQFLDRHELRFDIRFNDIGGSDSFLFRQFWDHGGKVISCQEAITYEEVPISRANEAWILRRAYKNAHTEYRRAWIRKGNIFASMLALFYGLWLWFSFYASLVLYPFYTHDFRVFNRRRKAKIKGLIHAYRGKTHQEYDVVHGG